MNVNAKGVWLGCQYAITHFMKHEPLTTSTVSQVRGHIASIGGLIGLALEQAYCASKGAVVNLTHELALDFAPERTNVNATCPRFLATAMVRSFLENDDMNKLHHDLTPWPRVGMRKWVYGLPLPKDLDAYVERQVDALLNGTPATLMKLASHHRQKLRERGGAVRNTRTK
jgi:NAD(P)-dependent dehydrogenase (short-subunit alcohol dehydrogenase family)